METPQKLFTRYMSLSDYGVPVTNVIRQHSTHILPVLKLFYFYVFSKLYKEMVVSSKIIDSEYISLINSAFTFIIHVLFEEKLNFLSRCIITLKCNFLSFRF
jgi:hypothetical protein